MGDLAAALDEIEALRAEIGALQDAVRKAIIDAVGAEHSNEIDGGASDGGPIEFTVAEVRQGFNIMADRLEELRSKADGGHGAEVPHG